MNVILYSRRRGDARQIDLLRPLPVTLAALAFIAVFAIGFLSARGGEAGPPTELIEQMRDDVTAQRSEIQVLQSAARENLDALSVRMGQLNSRMIRLDALGRRLVTMADLEDGEFDFDQAPAQGGPDSGDVGQSLGTADLDAMLDELALQIENRTDQLTVLEELMASRRLRQDQHPEGRPIRSGWLSSYYGNRADPFSGKQKLHAGVDFAGKEGSDVVAVASGVVTWSGKRYNYGTMVEIAHGNGLVTRYAHNKDNLVTVGETVKKGQVIASMGRSGRATGPHVHFEVLKNGVKVNPLKYLQP